MLPIVLLHNFKRKRPSKHSSGRIHVTQLDGLIHTLVWSHALSCNLFVLIGLIVLDRAYNSRDIYISNIFLASFNLWLSTLILVAFISAVSCCLVCLPTQLKSIYITCLENIFLVVNKVSFDEHSLLLLKA